MVTPVVQVVGFSNTGKTLLVEGLIRILKKRGIRVAAIKHAPHGYAVDVPGKDTRQYYEAGAEKVVVVGPESITVHERFREVPDLSQVCGLIQDVDLIIVEGFKRQAGPKIEVLRKEYSPERLDVGDDLIAVVSDSPVDDPVPCFAPQEIEPLVDFILKRFSVPKGSW